MNLFFCFGVGFTVALEGVRCSRAHIWSSLVNIPGLPAYCGGLAENPHGAVTRRQPSRGHEDLAQVRKPVWQEWQAGECPAPPWGGGWGGHPAPGPVLCLTWPLVLKALAHKTLVLLLGVDPSRQLDHPLPTVHPQVTYAYMKNMWKSARKVCTRLQQQTTFL